MKVVKNYRLTELTVSKIKRIKNDFNFASETDVVKNAIERYFTELYQEKSNEIEIALIFENINEKIIEKN